MFYSVYPPIRRLLVLLFLIILSDSYAQVNSSITDSLKTKNRHGIILQLDRRNSFIHKNHIGINGILIGVQYKIRHQFSVGFYCLEPWKKPQVITKQNSLGSYRESAKFNLYYGSLRYKYTFFEKNRISVGIPFELGFGVAHAKVVLLDYNIKAAVHVYFIPAQVGCFLRVKVTRWFAVFGSIGYRTLIMQNLFTKPGGITVDYSGMYYHYGVSIYIKNIIHDAKKHKTHL